MKLKRLISGSTLGLIGFLLSPLSWWNDLFVNVPLALGFSWFVSVFYPSAFYSSFIVGYWLTNVLGFVLMHKGAELLLSEKSSSYDRKALIKGIAFSLAYTGLIVVLMKFKIFQPLPNYLLEK